MLQNPSNCAIIRLIKQQQPKKEESNEKETNTKRTINRCLNL
jgi:hypothetical protein